jgi:hypothetical protein
LIAGPGLARKQTSNMLLIEHAKDDSGRSLGCFSQVGARFACIGKLAGLPAGDKSHYFVTDEA